MIAMPSVRLLSSSVFLCHCYPQCWSRFRQPGISEKLDLCSPYNLIQIQEGDKWKTTFINIHGHCKYQVMPFGLENAPAIFQSFMNIIFPDLIDRSVIDYVNELLIYSKSLAELTTHIR